MLQLTLLQNCKIFQSQTSLGAATLLRPLFPRPFPPGSGESVNLEIDNVIHCEFIDHDIDYSEKYNFKKTTAS